MKANPTLFLSPRKSKMLPTVHFDKETESYTFTLWRDEKVVHEFKAFSITINASNETVINGFSSVHTEIVDAGQLYRIVAQPCQGEDTIISLSMRSSTSLTR